MRCIPTLAPTLLLIAGCNFIPPPAVPVTLRVPDLAGPFPPLERGMSRMIIDVRDPAGEVSQFSVYEDVYGNKKLLCARVPCMVDFKRLSSHRLWIVNWALGDFEETDPKFLAEVPVYMDTGVLIVLVNAGHLNMAAGGGGVPGNPSVKQFAASPDDAHRFLAEEPPVAR